MDLLEWYRNTVGENSENQVARQAGIVQRTLNRQLAKGELAPESVAAIARAYRKDVLDALVIAGLITSKDIRDHRVKAALDEASDKEISEIVARRLSRGEHPEFEGRAMANIHRRQSERTGAVSWQVKYRTPEGAARSQSFRLKRDAEQEVAS